MASAAFRSACSKLLRRTTLLPPRAAAATAARLSSSMENASRPRLFSSDFARKNSTGEMLALQKEQLPLLREIKAQIRKGNEEGIFGDTRKRIGIPLLDMIHLGMVISLFQTKSPVPKTQDKTDVRAEDADICGKKAKDADFD